MKKFKLALSFLALSAAACVTSTLAWFTGNTISWEYEGHTASSYYASGAGTQDDPYIINNPIHLYNLAWLQYLGTYNTHPADPSIPDQFQSYFKLDADLDMSGYTIPPIGTTTYPFISNFDGNDHVINNLTTSNAIGAGEIEKKPLNITEDHLDGVNTVGMFGVIGSYQGQTLEYDTSINEVKNFKVDNASIHNRLSNALTGIVAGYVNGEIDNVGVVGSSLDIKSGTAPIAGGPTSKLSDHTTVGYAVPEFRKQIKDGSIRVTNATRTEVDFVKQGSGGEQGWGGSIDMLSMYEHLRTQYNNFTRNETGTGSQITPVKIPTQKTITSDWDYNKTENVTSEKVVRVSQSGSVPSDYMETTYGTASTDAYYWSFDQRDASNNVTSSYSYVQQPGYQNDNQYMCLTGYADRGFADQLSVTESGYFLDSAQYIKSGNHYLSLNGTTVVDQTSETNATRWVIDVENDAIYTIIENTAARSITKYYLNVSGGVLRASTTQSTSWTITAENGIMSENGYIEYNNGWVFTTASMTSYYLSYNNRYLNANGTSISTASSTTPTTAFTITNNNGSYIYITSGGTKYYLATNSKNGTTLRLSTSTTYALQNFDGKLYYKNGNYYTYLNLNNTTWRLTRNSGTSIPQITLTSSVTAPSFDFPDAGDVRNYGSESYQTDSTWRTEDTFFPLSHENGVPTDKNTGYVVAGANYFGDRWGDIRVSRFATTSLSGSGGAALSSVRTINATRDHVLTSTEIASFQKYTDSLAQMKSVLTKSINTGDKWNEKGIFGLHFMDSTISIEDNYGHQCRIPYASVNGNIYENYQVPMDAINFRLKEKGYINFFAGSYYTNNNSFFSLYDVFRYESDPTSIKEIKEIMNIYSDPSSEGKQHSYVYQYADNTYSVPFKFQVIDGVRTKVKLDGTTYNEYDRVSRTKHASYTSLVFNCSWIKNNTLTSNCAYYFEIPTNDGEYALGSVTGAKGAYLMYLDIGANAEAVNRTQFIQQTIVTMNVGEFPTGIAVIATVTSSMEDIQSNTVAVGIDNGASGNINLSRTGDEYTITGDSSKYTPTYINPATLYNSSHVTIPIQYIHSEQVTYTYRYDIDYNRALGQTIITTIEDITGVIDGETISHERSYTVLDEEGYEAEDQNMYDNEGHKIENIQDATMNSSGCTRNVYEITYNYEANVTYIVGITYTAISGDKVYYNLTGNEIEVTTDEPISINVTLLDSGNYQLTINGEVVSTSGEVIINP